MIPAGIFWIPGGLGPPAKSAIRLVMILYIFDRMPKLSKLCRPSGFDCRGFTPWYRVNVKLRAD
jgi:hypothetical protein